MIDNYESPDMVPGTKLESSARDYELPSCLFGPHLLFFFLYTVVTSSKSLQPHKAG